MILASNNELNYFLELASESVDTGNAVSSMLNHVELNLAWQGWSVVGCCGSDITFTH